MKKLVSEFGFSPEQLHEIENLARAVSLTPTTTGILYARGIDTAAKIDAFLHPSLSNCLSPFLMQGMREAADLIARAREEEWRVAVFGDYDADGIGACAILSRALRRYGITPYLFVPERTDGYGLTVSAIDTIFDEFLPDLVITVDCGISCRREVEYIKEQGAFVIVTDHHELPDELPDCIVVNPKLKDDYPYDNLCGAGVAFKLAQALIGEEANDLVDFAAVSTVADSVPLTGENRDIVAEGLRRMESPRPAFAALLGKNTEITAQTLAFTVAPRVNAAGRMGDAKAALKLFTSEDEEEIAELCNRLNGYNTERQKYCDELYAQARAEIAEAGAYGNVVMLANEAWNAGFVGIVAARIAEEFSRPTLLFVRKGDTLKGSARSIENVNIFDALKGCSEYITEFGGHAQAAGVNVSRDRFEALRTALDAYIGSHYSREDFTPVIAVAGKGERDFRTLAHELTLLEPCGVGNRRPLFYLEAEETDAHPLKAASTHLSFNVGSLELVYFNGMKDLEVLRSDLKKRIVFEYNVSHFRGKEYVKGFVRCVLYEGPGGPGVELRAFEDLLRLAARPKLAQRLTGEEAETLLKERLSSCAYGLCILSWDRGALQDLAGSVGLVPDVFRPSSGSLENTLLYAPAVDCDLSAYREVIVMNGPPVFPATGRAKLYYNASASDMGAIKEVSCVREDLLTVFAALKKYDGAEAGSGYAETARRLALSQFSYAQVVFALAVFEELGLISLDGGRLLFHRGKKTDLANSHIYTAVCRAKEGR